MQIIVWPLEPELFPYVSATVIFQVPLLAHLLHATKTVNSLRDGLRYEWQWLFLTGA